MATCEQILNNRECKTEPIDLKNLKMPDGSRPNKDMPDPSKQVLATPKEVFDANIDAAQKALEKPEVSVWASKKTQAKAFNRQLETYSYIKQAEAASNSCSLEQATKLDELKHAFEDRYLNGKRGSFASFDKLASNYFTAFDKYNELSAKIDAQIQAHRSNSPNTPFSIDKQTASQIADLQVKILHNIAQTVTAFPHAKTGLVDKNKTLLEQAGNLRVQLVKEADPELYVQVFNRGLLRRLGLIGSNPTVSELSEDLERSVGTDFDLIKVDLAYGEANQSLIKSGNYRLSKAHVFPEAVSEPFGSRSPRITTTSECLEETAEKNYQMKEMFDNATQQSYDNATQKS